MRSLVAEIFQSLLRKSAFGLVVKFVVLRSQHHADRSTDGGKLDALLGRAAGGLCRELVALLERPGKGTAEAGTLIDREAVESRLAMNAAFDREIAEGAALGEADIERLAVGNGHRRIVGHGTAGNIDAARRAAERDPHGAIARGEGGRERADFDGGGKRRIAEQRVGGR